MTKLTPCPTCEALSAGIGSHCTACPKPQDAPPVGLPKETDNGGASLGMGA